MSELCCPTCEEAKPGCCCECGRELTPDELVLAPDPWEEELGGPDLILKDHLMCCDCAAMSARDI